MQRYSGLQISDLEPIQSSVEQELTLEEVKKIVGGSKGKYKKKDKENNLPIVILPSIVLPIVPQQPCYDTI